MAYKSSNITQMDIDIEELLSTIGDASILSEMGSDTITGVLSNVNNAINNIGNASVRYAETAGSAPASDVHDWAKANTKPTYTANEVGALPDTTKLADLTDDNDHRTVSDTEKNSWNNKVDKAEGYSLISSADLLKIGTNEDSINTLVGSGDGSIENMINSAIDLWASKITDDGTINTYAEAINWISTHASDYTALLGDVSNKVDKISGKGLSTNDFTTELLNKVNGIDAGANKTIVDTSLSSTSTNPVQNKVINTALGNKLNVSGGTITGNLTVKGTLSLFDGKNNQTPMKVYDDGDTSNYGAELTITANGNTFIGGGESSTALRTAMGTEVKSGEVYSASGECMYLSSDQNMYLYSNCNTITNRVGFTFDTTGNLRPLTNNTLSLGTSAIKWKSVYATSFDGGTASAESNGLMSFTDKNILDSIVSETDVVDSFNSVFNVTE